MYQIKVLLPLSPFSFLFSLPPSSPSTSVVPVWFSSLSCSSSYSCVSDCSSCPSSQSFACSHDSAAVVQCCERVLVAKNNYFISHYFLLDNDRSASTISQSAETCQLTETGTITCYYYETINNNNNKKGGQGEPYKRLKNKKGEKIE